MITWKIDPSHTEIGFKVKHLVVSTVKGLFSKYEADLSADDDTLVNAKLSFSADVSGITTHNAQRDGHLMSADFFDAEHFPKVTFVSKSFAKKEGNMFAVTGDLTMRGVTKEVVLDATFNGLAKGPMDGIRVAAFEVTGKIIRKDFGIAWNSNTETGGLVVGEEVVLDATVEFKEVA